MSTAAPQRDLDAIAYGGPCAACGVEHSLALTPEARRAAEALMAELRQRGGIDIGAATPDPRLSTEVLYADEGQMLGVLVGRDARGARVVLRAFSGGFNGVPEVAGWAPPLPSATRSPEAAREEAAIGALGLELAARSAELALAAAALAAAEVPEGQTLAACAAADAARRRARAERRAALHARLGPAADGRAAATAAVIGAVGDPGLAAQLETLDDESRREKSERRRRKAAAAARRAPLAAEVGRLHLEVARLASSRRERSRALMQALHASYRLPNFRGQTRPLGEVFLGDGMPCGTAECCAPKLLAAAASLGLRPEGLAEFWWGAPPAGQLTQPRHFVTRVRQLERGEGRFYPACADKCRPILGFMLCGADGPRGEASVARGAPGLADV